MRKELRGYRELLPAKNDMRRCTEEDEVYFIDSQPGDCTRYMYLVYRDGPDNFCFTPTRSTFTFPQRLNYWDIHGLDSEALVRKADNLGCNPWTLRECLRTMEELKNGEVV